MGRRVRGVVASPLLDTMMLLLGSALGIVSSPITDAIRRHSAKLRLTRVIVTELRSLQDTLAIVVIQVSRHRGELTHTLLEALLSTLKSSGQSAAEGKAMRTIDALLELDENLLTPSVARGRGGPRSLSIEGHELPFLESHVHRLDLYTHGTQLMLVEIRTGLQSFNHHAEEAAHYHFMMFDSGMGPTSLDALRSNIESCYARAAEKASDLVARIAVVVQSPEMRTA